MNIGTAGSMPRQVLDYFDAANREYAKESQSGYSNFLALRQAVTPEPLLGRMTSTMRWLILLPAGPGALIGGWLGEHAGLRAALVFAGTTAIALSYVAWRQPIIRSTRALPKRKGSRWPSVSMWWPRALPPSLPLSGLNRSSSGYRISRAMSTAS